MKSSLMLKTVVLSTLSVCALGSFEEDFLKRFNENPVEAMQELPPKTNQRGQKVKSVVRGINKDNVVQVKSAARDEMSVLATNEGTKRKVKVKFKNVGAPGRAPIGVNDNPADLVEDFTVKTLDQIEEKKLFSAKLDESPWSDDYWAIYAGVIGKRYADRDVPGSSNWKELNDFRKKNQPKNPDDYSPAEKFDMLIGGNNLTEESWRQGEQYYTEEKGVETWMGICHGWSPAAYSVKRPLKAVDVKAGDKTITFYPSDIKALTSKLFAANLSGSSFVGGRCDAKNPKMDQATGRVVDKDCFDNNPATVVLALVNQIGVAKKGMVMDATFDYEVWNQPIYSYEMTFFNPKTSKPVSSIKEAKAELDSYKDKFAKYRSKKAVSVVGISLKITYTVETTPSHAATDSPSNDALTTAMYMLDLELDKDGKIIGGEWYQNAHPDFLWTPEKNYSVEVSGENYLEGAWDPSKEEVPSSWTNLAKTAAQSGIPLSKIVNALVEASQK